MGERLLYVNEKNKKKTTTTKTNLCFSTRSSLYNEIYSMSVFLYIYEHNILHKYMYIATPAIQQFRT